MIWIYQISTSNNSKYPIMIYSSLMNLFNSFPDELLITMQSCAVLICLYAGILFMLFRTKNKLNKQR